MTEVDLSRFLAQQFRTAVLEDDWFQGLLRHVAGVTSEHASRRLPGGTSSAAGQVGHVLYWLRLGRRWMAGDDVGGSQAESFRHAVVSEAEWQALRAELHQEVEAFAQLTAEVKEWDDRRLAVFVNQLTHVSYHAGSVIQILHATQSPPSD